MWPRVGCVPDAVLDQYWRTRPSAALCVTVIDLPHTTDQFSGSGDASWS